MNSGTLTARLRELDPGGELPVTGPYAEEIILVERSTYDDDEGAHECIVLELEEEQG